MSCEMGCDAPESFVNQNEVRIIGMARSGVHAIVNWITAQIDGRYCYLNCVDLKSNPFRTARSLTEGRPYRANYDSFDLQQEQSGDFSAKDYLLYNYEDCFLGMVCHDEFEARHDAFVGPSKRRLDVLVLRDPFNLFASRKKAAFVNPDTADVYVVSWKTARRIWKQYAREFIDGPRYLSNELVLIRYNDWVRDRDYRRQIAQDLGLSFTDAGVQSVSKCAGGSSFDGLRYDGRADRMNVLQRWKHFRDDPQYRALFDEEMLRFSEEIFGPIPGTERLVEKLAEAVEG